jgi:PST family polysaccharide transporter
MVSLITALLPRQLRIKLESRPNFHAIISNTGWLYFENLFRAAIGLFIGAWMARSLGPANLGALNYAITLVALFWSAATPGIDSIAIRELVRSPHEKQYLLGATFYLKIIGCLLSIVLALVAVFLLRPGDTESATLVAIIAAGKIFTPLETIDLWFKSQLNSRLAVIAKNIAFTCSSVVRVVLLFYSAGTSAFAWVLVLESFLTGACLMTIYNRYGCSLYAWRYKGETILQLLRDSWPIIITNITVIINLNIDKIILRELMNNEALGLYSAAVSISGSWYFVPLALGTSMYPALAKAHDTDKSLYIKRSRQLYDFTALLCIGIAILTTVFSDKIVRLLYGAGYAGCAPVLMIHVWSGLFLLLASASGRNLNIENENRIVLYRGLVGAVANIALNYLLIPYYGIIGVAYASVLSYGAMVFSLGLFQRSRGMLLPLLKAIFMVNAFQAVIRWQHDRK